MAFHSAWMRPVSRLLLGSHAAPLFLKAIHLRLGSLPRVHQFEDGGFGLGVLTPQHVDLLPEMLGFLGAEPPAKRRCSSRSSLISPSFSSPSDLSTRQGHLAESLIDVAISTSSAVRCSWELLVGLQLGQFPSPLEEPIDAGVLALEIQ